MSENKRFVTLEFVVQQLKSDDCVKSINNALSSFAGDVKSVSMDVDHQRMLVETCAPWNKVMSAIEGPDRKAVLMGVGDSTDHTAANGAAGKITQAAVCIMTGEGVNGVVRFVSLPGDTVVVDGTLDVLTSGHHAVRVHEYGDLSEGCNSCGNPMSEQWNKVVGFSVDKANPRVDFRDEFVGTTVSALIGRSMVLHANHGSSLICPPSCIKLACGIIARSSGLFDNSKRICACSGSTIWDEREAAKKVA